ncbi:TetR/AcrR family transcriptional regulator [Streptomyces acidiscabies]|uniref:Helix-turn-helix domain containing protein n=1 Tax=Streptomyces acidiscabies TaxID=42234 RepID=A0AAP6BIQ5_9ACTN|nr:TetR/AcrR family transcriptional regulator [Streptomyces acidiscabies]MBP5935205.1 helix-turn-helix transcriptional regulator [Streptomyces sp. LBUM 1476]MBZ3916966.1 helix-turn-helix transcriptional regulator [Streptomyces acidiscabies]MDX2965501.1 helix-turn-helix domain containing protein [Streptomyces acidiscabies]MDX3024274.1 helix-turn-helix domain containing protein [Streptomyces acidiscabies]MDX3793081.1 helix-turn-helix domain containing protein [Streptomyces acidiscabies]
MSPRSASVNEELRRRSRERLLLAALELVGERGYDATTLGDIADRAGSARGLVSYYFPGKRQLVQSAVHRLMHRTLQEALESEPCVEGGAERMARAIDAVLGLARDRTVLMRQHMAGMLDTEGFVQCPEQRRLAELLRDTVVRHGSRDVDTDYPMLRAQLMGAVYGMVLPNVPLALETLRAELFGRYGLEWGQGFPPDAEASGGVRDLDLSRFFETGHQPK